MRDLVAHTAASLDVGATDDDLYERDFYAWTQRQAALIREGDLAAVDMTNVLEEIETLGRKEVSELRSRCTVLATHLLKEIFQPARAGRSWRLTIVNQRVAIARHMRDNPSLKPKADDIFAEAYADARLIAAVETGLPVKTFPVMPPFSRLQAVTLPEE